MQDNLQNLYEVSKEHVEKAQDFIETAKMSLENEKYNNAIRCAYYACYHLIYSIIVLDGVIITDRNKHKATIEYLRDNYIETGVFKEKHDANIENARVIRNAVDYKPGVFASIEVAQEIYEDALAFFTDVNDYIINRLNMK